MNYLLLFLHLFVLSLVAMAGIYMGLFTYRVLQRKQKIEISLPSPIKMLLTANIIAVLFAGLLISFLTLLYYLHIT